MLVASSRYQLWFLQCQILTELLFRLLQHLFKLLFPWWWDLNQMQGFKQPAVQTMRRKLSKDRWSAFEGKVVCHKGQLVHPIKWASFQGPTSVLSPKLRHTFLNLTRRSAHVPWINKGRVVFLQCSGILHYLYFWETFQTSFVCVRMSLWAAMHSHYYIFQFKE